MYFAQPRNHPKIRSTLSAAHSGYRHCPCSSKVLSFKSELESWHLISFLGFFLFIYTHEHIKHFL